MKRTSLDTYCIGIFFIVMMLCTPVHFENFKNHCHKENNSTLICNYIPRSLSNKYNYVRFVDFKRPHESIVLSNNSFSHESWENVQIIEFNDRSGRESEFTFDHECFKGLRSLKEIKIHIYYFFLATDAFVGVPSVHTLDVSNCYRLYTEDFLNALKDKKALPALKNLKMSEMGTYVNEPININKTSLMTLSARNITKFDLSGTQINFINATALLKFLRALEHLNLSYAVIGHVWTDNILQSDLLNLNVIDVSYSVLPAQIIQFFPRNFTIANTISMYSKVPDIKTFFTPMVINASGIVPAKISIWVYNCTVIIDTQVGWKTKHLNLRNNNFKYFGIIIKCQVYKLTSVTYVDLSDNGMEMLYPNECVPNLESIILSKNELFKMLDTRPNLFEKLFASHTKLRVINLAHNRLSNIPRNMFVYNKLIERIDLSFSQLEQLHFDLMDLHYLRVLDVSDNIIKVLDEVSINNVNNIGCSKSKTSVSNHCSVFLSANPISCSSCSCKSFINWLLTSKQVNVSQQDLMCMTDEEIRVNVEKSVIGKVQLICYRRFVIILSTVSASVTLLAVGVTIFLLYRRKKLLQRKRNMDAVLAKLIEGNDQHEFVVFLSYSSRDEEFVQYHVINQLNENLQLIIGTDRSLVCTGDTHLRPGFMVHDETTKCMDRSSVVILVVSDNFCRSSYCVDEFDQAYLQRKHIVLMLLGNVNEELMTPTLKHLYKRDVRILWTVENEQFVLKNTWQNICSAVLEKVEV